MNAGDNSKLRQRYRSGPRASVLSVAWSPDFAKGGLARSARDIATATGPSKHSRFLPWAGATPEVSMAGSP